jgi:hypothetical protein
VSSKAGRLLIFSLTHRMMVLIVNSEGACDASDAHAVLVSSHRLLLERLIVARPFGLQDERALTLQTFGAMGSALRVAVFADALAAAARADMDNRRGKHQRNPAGPAAGLLFRNLFWPNASLWTGDGSDAYQVSLGGTLLDGRSLRSAADASVREEYPNVWDGQGNVVIPSSLVGRRPLFTRKEVAPYWNLGWRANRAAGLSFPLRGEVAAVGLWEFDFLPGDPFREIEVEVQGANYDGKVIDWQQGRAMVTNTIGSGPHEVIVLPTFASVRRNADFARARLQVTQNAQTNATFAKPWAGGGSSVMQLGIVRNVGEADVLVTDLLPATARPQDQRFYAVGVVWRGQSLRISDFLERRPLQLRPGEELQIQVGYSADPILPRNSAPLQETGLMTVRTNDANIGATLPLTANVSADFPGGSLAASDKNGTYLSYDFGQQKDTLKAVGVSAILTDAGGVPLTVRSVSFNPKGSAGFSVATPNGLIPQPVPGQPNRPPQVEFQVYYTLGKGRFGVQTNALFVDTNAGLLKLPLRIEAVP